MHWAALSMRSRYDALRQSESYIGDAGAGPAGFKRRSASQGAGGNIRQSSGVIPHGGISDMQPQSFGRFESRGFRGGSLACVRADRIVPHQKILFCVINVGIRFTFCIGLDSQSACSKCESSSKLYIYFCATVSRLCGPRLVAELSTSMPVEFEHRE